MANPIQMACSKCSTALSVPEELAGKKVKCKKCQNIMTVPAAVKPLPEDFAKPAKASKPAPAKAKPKSSSPPPPDADAPIKLADDEAEDDANPYGVTRESDKARCPHCAKELEEENAQICLNCGYDLRERKRKEMKAVIELTSGDYVVHHLPAVMLVFLAFILIAVCAVCWMYMKQWIGPWVENGEKDPVTDEPGYYLKPWCCSLWITITVIWINYKIFKFAFIRFFINNKPLEAEIKKKGD